MLREVVPKLFRIAAILNPTNPTYRTELRDTKEAAKALGVQVETIEVSDLSKLQNAFTRLRRDRVNALLVFTDAIFYSMRAHIVEYAAMLRLPVMYWQHDLPTTVDS